MDDEPMSIKTWFISSCWHECPSTIWLETKWAKLDVHFGRVYARMYSHNFTPEATTTPLGQLQPAERPEATVGIEQALAAVLDTDMEWRCLNCLTYFLVSTHLKNMLVNMWIFHKQGENKTYLKPPLRWNPVLKPSNKLNPGLPADPGHPTIKKDLGIGRCKC